MKSIKKILFLFLASSQLLGENEIYRDNSLLFSIWGKISQLEIDGDFYRSNHNKINSILNKYGIIKIEPWLKSATETDFDGEIYLNRIYRITLSEKTKIDILNAMHDLKKISDIQYVERENIHRVFYTPNDSQYNQQWFLPDINSNDAWNFWDINSGETPGNKQVILASVDTGVNWKHSDLESLSYPPLR